MTSEKWAWVIRTSKDRPNSFYYDASITYDGGEYIVVNDVSTNLNDLAIELSNECSKRNKQHWLPSRWPQKAFTGVQPLERPKGWRP